MANMNKLLKQAQKMQEKVQQEMEALVIEESVGGGMVTIRINGQKQVLSISIDPTLLDGEEKEMLEDLIVAAVNQASGKVDETMQEKLGGMVPGMGLPGF